MDAEKLAKWSKEIYENAVAHRWHEEEHSPEHYLGLVMTEVAEAVEADRNNHYCGEVETEMSDYVHNFDAWYRGWVKSSVEEEFADIVIRLLDMNIAIYGRTAFLDSMVRAYGGVYFNPEYSFIENAWILTRKQLGVSVYEVLKSIQFIDLWAKHLNIDLDQHIEWKMKYNSLRPYKHGGKKY